MDLIIGVAVIITILIAVIIVLMYMLLGKDTDKSKDSKHIINKFEPENTAPRITELIDYHKTKSKIKYMIESDDKDDRTE